MPSIFKRLLLVGTVLNVTLLFAAPTVTWGSNFTGAWEEAANWAEGRSPEYADEVRIVARGETTITINKDTTVKNVVISAANEYIPTVTFTGNGMLTITEGLILEKGIAFVLNTPTTSGTLHVGANAIMTFNNGKVWKGAATIEGTLTGSGEIRGTTTFLDGATLNAKSGTMLLQGDVAYTGTLNILPPGHIPAAGVCILKTTSQSLPTAACERATVTFECREEVDKNTPAGLYACTTARVVTTPPETLLIAPMCQPTDWNQTAETSVGGYVCGCDPLAWGQIVTYHALKAENPCPAHDWVRSSAVTNDVHINGEAVARSTILGLYDWEKIRDKERSIAFTREDIALTEVQRLMWDIGVLGEAFYISGGTAGTAWKADKVTPPDYFGYQSRGYDYDFTLVGTEAERRERLRVLMRLSLQSGAPLLTDVSMHVMVTDGWGIDAEGNEWFHIDKGYGSGNTIWRNLDALIYGDKDSGNVNSQDVIKVVALAHPKALGSLVVGRIADAARQPIADATITLTAEDGTIYRTTSDENGLYCLKGLPLVDTTAYADPAELPKDHYTLQVAKSGYLPSHPTAVVIGGFIGETLRAEKHVEYEKINGKADADFFYPNDIGGAVADVTLEPLALTQMSAPWAIWTDFTGAEHTEGLAPNLASTVDRIDAAQWRLKLNDGKVVNCALQTGVGVAPMIDFGQPINFGTEGLPFTLVMTVKRVSATPGKPLWNLGRTTERQSTTLGVALSSMEPYHTAGIQGVWNDVIWDDPRNEERAVDALAGSESVTLAFDTTSDLNTFVVTENGVTRLTAWSGLKGSNLTAQYLHFGNTTNAKSGDTDGLNYTLEKVALFRGSPSEADLIAFAKGSTTIDHDILKAQGYADTTLTKLLSENGELPRAITGNGNKKPLSANEINVALECFEGITTVEEDVAAIDYTFGINKMEMGTDTLVVEVGVQGRDGAEATFAEGVTCELRFIDLATNTESTETHSCERINAHTYRASIPIDPTKTFLKARVFR